jgi:RNA polymerase sigma factor (sigma-70 family)
MTQPIQEDVLTMGSIARPRASAVDEPTLELVDALFRQHYVGLVRLGVVMTGDREAAEDAVQEAFTSLHRNRGALRDRDSAEAYLRSAVLNRCRSWVRRQVTRKAARPLMLAREVHESPEDAAVVRDEVGALVTAMRSLPRRQREVLACRYVLELSIEETAALLDISDGSVKTHTHRGLKALHQRIEVAR